MAITVPSFATSAVITSTAFNTNYAVIGNEVNRVAGLVDGATTTGAASTLMKTNATGGTQVTAVSIVATNPAGGALYIRGAASPTVPLETVQNSAATLNLRTTDGSGNGVFLGSVTATGFIGNVTGNVSGSSGSTTGNAATASALLAPVLAAGVIADYLLTTAGTLGHLTVGAGGRYEDTNGQIVGPLGNQDLNVLSLQDATQLRYIAVSLAPGSGGPVATAATAGAALNTIAVPLANKLVGAFGYRPASTNATGAIVAGDFLDVPLARIGGSGGGATGGSGNDSGVRSSSLWLQGTNVIYSGAHDSTNPADPGNLDPALMRSNGAGQVGLDKIRDVYIQPDMGGRIQSSSSNQVQIVASASSPVTFGHAGLLKTNTASVVSGAASGTAGIRTIVGDVGASGTAGFTVALLAPGTAPSSTQAALGLAYWDGATLQTGIMDLSALASVASQQVALTTVKAALTTVVSGFTTTPFAIPTGMQQTVFYTTTAMRGLVTLYAAGSLGTGTTGDVIFRAQIVNTVFGTQQPVEDVIFQTAASQGYRAKGVSFDTPAIIQPGVNTLSMVVQADSPSQVNINAATVMLALFHL